MNSAIDKFFDQLKRQLDILSNSNVDNEAMRHDLIVRPIITNPLVLDWDDGEVISQSVVEVPMAVRESYFWDKAEPKKKRPDMIIIPYGMKKTVAIVEEKKKQASLNALAKKIGQIKEYQYLHNAVWGILTDGEKWILQKNNEMFHTFETLDELRKNVNNLRECIGKSALLERLIKYGTADLVIFRPTINITVVLSIGKIVPRCNIEKYLMMNSLESLDLLSDIHKVWRNVFYEKAKEMFSLDMYELVEDVYSNLLVDTGGALIGYKELILLQSLSNKDTRDLSLKYRTLLKEWLRFLPRINELTRDIKSGTIWPVDEIMKLFADSQKPLWLSEKCSETFLKKIIESSVLGSLPVHSREHIKSLYREKVYRGKRNEVSTT